MKFFITQVTAYAYSCQFPPAFSPPSSFHPESYPVQWLEGPSYFTLLQCFKNMTPEKDLYLLSAAVILKVQCAQATSE